jgi:hypothetical protein
MAPPTEPIGQRGVWTSGRTRSIPAGLLPNECPVASSDRALDLPEDPQLTAPLGPDIHAEMFNDIAKNLVR